ncbi:hypothetical protein CYMTET_15343, partial [Cymbomonas tetramitiformis]
RRRELLLTAPLKGPDEDQTPEEDKNLVELAKDAALAATDSIMDATVVAKDSLKESTENVMNLSMGDLKRSTSTALQTGTQGVMAGMSAVQQGVSTGLKIAVGEDKEDSDEDDEEKWWNSVITNRRLLLDAYLIPGIFCWLKATVMDNSQRKSVQSGIGD